MLRPSIVFGHLLVIASSIVNPLNPQLQPNILQLAGVIPVRPPQLLDFFWFSLVGDGNTLDEEFLASGNAPGFCFSEDAVGLELDGLGVAGLEDALTGIHFEIVGSRGFYLNSQGEYFVGDVRTRQDVPDVQVGRQNRAVSEHEHNLSAGDVQHPIYSELNL